MSSFQIAFGCAVAGACEYIEDHGGIEIESGVRDREESGSDRPYPILSQIDADVCRERVGGLPLRVQFSGNDGSERRNFFAHRDVECPSGLAMVLTVEVDEFSGPHRSDEADAIHRF